MKITTLLIVILNLISCGKQSLLHSESKDFADATSVTIRADGRYDVTCKDGTYEVASQDDVRSGNICGGKSLRLIANGLLEYKNQDSWRGVCDDNFDSNAAQVACRELGGKLNSFQTSMSGPNSSFWLDDLDCRGDESRIADCRHSGLGNHNCNSNEWVQLKCDFFSNPPPPPVTQYICGECGTGSILTSPFVGNGYSVYKIVDGQRIFVDRIEVGSMQGCNQERRSDQRCQ